MSCCLYCQCDNPNCMAECHNCGMPLPSEAELSEDSREWHFIWFCTALTVFCLTMSIWLPRALF